MLLGLSCSLPLLQVPLVAVAVVVVDILPRSDVCRGGNDCATWWPPLLLLLSRTRLDFVSHSRVLATAASSGSRDLKIETQVWQQQQMTLKATHRFGLQFKNVFFGTARRSRSDAIEHSGNATDTASARRSINILQR